MAAADGGEDWSGVPVKQPILKALLSALALLWASVITGCRPPRLGSTTVVATAECLGKEEDPLITTRLASRLSWLGHLVQTQ